MKECSNCKQSKEDSKFPRTGKQCIDCLVLKRKTYPSVANRESKARPTALLSCSGCGQHKKENQFTYANVWRLKEERKCKRCVDNSKNVFNKCHLL